MLDEIVKTLGKEGGYVNNSADAGGETNFGISKRSYPNVDIKNLTREAAGDIYLRDYWTPLKCDRIASRRVRWKLLDIGVHCGLDRAAKMLQRAAGVGDDGKIGDITLNAVNGLCATPLGEMTLLKKILQEQTRHYANIVVKNASQAQFLMGWLDRAFDDGASLG